MVKQPITNYQLPTTSPALLVIVGPTASGKSDLTLKIARAYRGEVISADSWTVYKGFNIGTAKPSTTQQKAIKHHLLDVREPKEGFNAPMFKALAEKAIKNIQKQGKLPIMAGGTGLYIDSVLFDYGFLPDTTPEERDSLNMLTIPELIELAEAAGIDLSGIDLRNKRRIIRAIESKGQKPTKKAIREGALVVGLHIPREELRKRIEQRTKQMLKAGLEQEVKKLSERYGWNIEPMKGIGYKQWRNYFEGRQSLEQTKQRIVSATMNLAKRQETWFNRSQHIQWFSSIEDAYRFITKALNN